jgi:hypothetical protein
MRHVSAAAFGLALSMLPALALAEGKPLPPPSSDATPPIALTITLDGDKPVCDPAELLVPANTNVTFNIVNQANRDVTLTMPGQFKNGLVLHADGDLVHVASEDGYLVKRNGKGTLKVRSMEPGQEEYACTSVNNQQAPFKGTYVRKETAK